MATAAGRPATSPPPETPAPGPPARGAQGAGWRARGWDIPWLGGRSTAPWVVLVTVLILLAATVGTLVAGHRSTRLGWTVKTIDVRDDTAVVFTFDVFKAPRAEAACDIAAADDAGGVGTLRGVIIPPRTDGESNTRTTVTVQTTRRARTAVLEGCHITRTG